jgi:NADP-dependent 3-hydroxy acid dehydrogenase YdfG
MNSSNPTIIVSGCTKGIGRAICEYFAAQGFNVGGYARTQKDIEEMQHLFSETFPQQSFFFASANASNKSDIQNFSEKVKSHFSSVEVLVNNAGVFLPGSIIEEKDGTLEQLIETNLYSAYYLIRFLHPIIKRNIFNICSIASIQAYDAGASYTISKFAMLGFSKQLRKELQPSGIKVTAVMPGAVLTQAWGGVDLPESRFIKEQDIAQLIWSAYNLSDSADLEELIIRPQLGDI